MAGVQPRFPRQLRRPIRLRPGPGEPHPADPGAKTFKDVAPYRIK